MKENQHIEFKPVFNEEAMETLTAFANTKGGKVLIGVSTPRNKLVADFCKNLRLIEKYGSGIGRIVDAFKKANLPTPEFRNISEGFQVTVFSESIPEDHVDKTVVKDVSAAYVVENVVENERKIIELLKQDPTLSARAISQHIDVVERTAQRYLKSLVD